MRATAWLYYEKDLSQHEVAERLNVPVAQSSSLRFRSTTDSSAWIRTRDLTIMSRAL